MHPHPATKCPRPAASRGLLRHLYTIGPVAALTAVALAVALRAMPLPGAARFVYAIAVALDAGLLGLACWSAILALAPNTLRR